MSGTASTSLAVRTASIVNVVAPGRCALASVSVALISSRIRSLEPDELELDDLAHSDHGHGQEIAHRREHDVLGPHDDGRLVAAAQCVRPAVDVEIRLAEPHVAIAVRPEQQIRAAQERGDEPRAGLLIQRARLADFLQPPAIHDADSVRHAERFFLIVRHEHRRDADGALNLTDRAP